MQNENEIPGSGGATGAEETRHEGAQGNGSAGAGQADFANYRSFPALAAYIDRVGAEQRNFRRFVVRLQGAHGYFYDAVIIKIGRDGVIECNDEEYKPTEAEQAAISAALAAETNWPKSVAASLAKLAELRALIGGSPELRAAKSGDGNTILMVQQRVRKQDGSKADLPWSFWSDGVWRCMEPDGLLPLFGLDQLAHKAGFALHEGYKGAEHVAAALARSPSLLLDAHPWLRDFPWRDSLLANCAQLGWPGGALNPHRVDWEPLRKRPKNELGFIVCDNDFGGEEAAPKISRQLQRRLGVIRFGSAFPPTFDLADKFPDGMYEIKNGQRVYRGPDLMDCWSPATWATRKVGKDYLLRDEFIQEWYAVVKPAVFVHRQFMQVQLSDDEFNAHCRPYTDGRVNVAELLRKSQRAQAAGLAYIPGETSGAIAISGRHGQYVNVFTPSEIVPAAGDAGLWKDFLAHLIPNRRDRARTAKWCATLIARPDVRMTYSMLLISETQGVGKGTVGNILRALVGKHNCSTPSSDTIADKYTSWVLFKRLAIIGELYSGHSSKVYNKLKEIVSDDFIGGVVKYQNEFSVENFLHVFACSNSMRALKFEDSDRRWLIPEVTEEAKPHSYWKKLYAWLNAGGYAVIAHWAQDYVKRHGHVQKGEHAPSTERKREAIMQSRSDGERYIAELGEALKRIDGQALMRLDHVRAWLITKKAASPQLYGVDGRRFLETPETISKVLRGCGLQLPKRQHEKGEEKFRVVANFAIPGAATWARDLEGLCRQPADVAPF